MIVNKKATHNESLIATTHKINSSKNTKVKIEMRPQNKDMDETKRSVTNILIDTTNKQIF